VAAAVDAHFDGVNVEFRQEFLEVGEDIGGEGLTALFLQ
jgi:hypothetical protein